MLYFDDSWNKVYLGDCRSMELPNSSVQCVVTSPPYWGLRKYEGEQEIEDWGCAFGLEPTPEMYVQHTVEILREIRRVLRKDGVVFWNIGDSYFTQPAGNIAPCGFQQTRRAGQVGAYAQHKGQYKPNLKHPTLKQKDLCLIPFRVAIAAQEDGWWVRQVIIWAKPNPMPESCKDRPTRAHEYILMLAKSAKYYWDADAVREPNQGAPFKGKTYKYKGDEETVGGIAAFRGTPNYQNPLGRNLRSVWTFPTQPYPDAHFAVFPEKLPEICIKASTKESDVVLDPFMGSGTTLMVAKKLKRIGIGYDLSEEYCDMTLKRTDFEVE